MSIFLDRSDKVLVQGITGTEGVFWTKHMIELGTNVVAGVTPGKEGQIVEGIPVYHTIRRAVSFKPANAAMLFVPPRFTKDAVFEALDAGIRKIVTIADGIPLQDAIQIRKAALSCGARVIGGNTSGVISPGSAMMGMFPYWIERVYRPGRIGIMTRSGSLTNEVTAMVVRAGFGVSSLIGVGGDPVPGTRFSEMLPDYQADTGTDAVVIIGELGVLVITAFITKSGLGKRISAIILSITGNSTRAIIFGFLAAGTILSMWITDMAVAAMLMPLARAILQEEGCKPKESNFGKALMIAVAWGALVGGIGTPAGTGANPIALQFLVNMAGIRLSFLDWMVYGVPSALLILPVAWLVLVMFFPPEMKNLKVTKAQLKAELKKMPPMGREEIITLVVFVLTILIWVATPLLEGPLGMVIEISMPALLAACLFFMPGMSKAKWKEIEGEIDWAGILLIVSGISLGTYLYKTGVAEWLAITLLGRIGDVPVFAQLFLVTLGVCLLKVVFSSNTVTATILIPLIIGLGKATGIDVTGITLAAGLTTSLAFILVTTTPTNVIPFNAGYFSIRDMAKAGLVLTVGASLVIAVVFISISGIKGGF